VLRRARDGVALDAVEAETALQARGSDLEDLCASAARVRDAGLAAAGRPGVITYSKKVFIPLTRLCRDRCHYCTFVTTPNRVHAPYLSVAEVVEIAQAGRALGCKEALFTLGDRPEARWSQAADWLEEAGYASTLDYVRACAIAVLESTGLLPHLNPGVMTWQEMARLKPVAPSMGMMLETTSRAVYEDRHGAHFGSPDKDPAVRLRVLADAGRSSIPFTTGILVGIGETLADRVESIFAIRSVAKEFGGIQEVIVQNFRAKPDTAMARMPDAELDEMVATIAVARLVLGPTMRIQAPPNLVDPTEYARVIAAGIDDWGGVSPLTPDHVNPERPWPQIEALAGHTAGAGFDLAERLTIYPRYVRAGEPWLDPKLRAHVDALADPVTGLAIADAIPEPRPWQEPDHGAGLATLGRSDLETAIDTQGRAADRRSDFDWVYGDWESLRAKIRAPRRADSDVAAALRAAERDPAGISDAQALTLFSADGADLDALCALADAIRADVVGDAVTYVVNRNINFTNVCYTGCRFCAFAQRRTDPDSYTLSTDEVAQRARQAWHLGATEVCMQGGIHPDLPGTGYFDIARAVKTAVPEMHVHAFSPMEVVNGATKSGMSIRDWLSAAEILDDDVRWILTKGKLPTEAWIEVVTTAHSLGIRSSSTMMYGHVDTPEHWVAHLRLLGRIQDQTGGFTEFVPLPFIHTSSPIYLAGLARPGPTLQENRAVHAMARLLLHGRIGNIQTSWVKLGVDGTRMMLRGGANDLGGTLMEETISRMAGSEFGSYKTVADISDVVEPLGRPAVQRTTTYGTVSDERRAASHRFQGLHRLEVAAV
jgi:FO synthase